MCWIGTRGFISKNQTLISAQTCMPINSFWFATILPILPYWWRFAQCLNKLYYTRNFNPHGINAIKYSTGIIYCTVYLANTMNGSHNPWSRIFILGISCHFVNAIYCWVWDVRMDWGLWQDKALLREELLLHSSWKYYAAMVFDFFARLIWIPQIWFSKLFDDTQAYPIAIFALIEIIRRSIWVFFRIEWEVMSNFENYRVIDFVPRLAAKSTIDMSDGQSKESPVLIDANKLFDFQTSSNENNLAYDIQTEPETYNARSSSEDFVLPQKNSLSAAYSFQNSFENLDNNVDFFEII